MDKGQCRRDPPKVFKVMAGQNVGFTTCWPFTDYKNWCGEYEEKYAETEEADDS